MKEGKKIYFASDVHLGAPYIKDARAHEIRFVKWLDTVKKDAEKIFLLGDIFDFWYEYKHSVPKGFTRFLGKLSELTDSGIEVHIFTGNHDVWLFDYLPEECGVIVHERELQITFGGKNFFLAHGDELGTFDRGYNFMKSVFRNKTAQWWFSKLHPDIAITFARWWSVKSRAKNERSHKTEYQGDDKEWPVLFAKDYINDHPEIDYFVFGHRHIARVIPLSGNSTIIYLGDWVKNFSYAVFDEEKTELKFFEKQG